MDKKPNHKRAAYLGLAFGVLALVSLPLVLVVATRNEFARRQPVLNSFVGTWSTDGGVILQLRADGSALVRYPRSPAEPISRFRWEIESDKLAFVNSRRKPRSLQARIYELFDPSWVVKDDIDRFKIVNVTTVAADLISLSQEGGESQYSTQWLRTDDATLDAAH